MSKRRITLKKRKQQQRDRRRRPWWKLNAKEWLKAALVALPMMFVVLIISYLLVGMTSGIVATSCTDIQKQTRAESFIDVFNTSGTLESFMSSIYATSLKADSLRAVLYNEEKTATIEIAAVVKEDSEEQKGVQKYSVVSSVNDRQRLSRHQARVCNATQKEDLTLMSCPMVDPSGYLTGFTLATYRRTLGREEITTYMSVLKLETEGVQDIIN